MYYTGQCEGWRRIVEALEEHGSGLSLPEGAGRPEEVVPAEVRHQLWLQDCISAELSGLGQEEGLTLTNPEQLDRISGFIDLLKECRESVAYLRLDLPSLMERVILPERDRPVFLSALQERLRIRSLTDPIAPALTG